MLKGFYYALIWPYFEAFSGLFEDFGKWLEGRMQRWRTEGFTLIEMSMVLVVIGLLVGGVLFGVDLVKAAEARAQVTQIDQINTAIDAFVTKYGYLPGDIPDPYASQFGLLARGTHRGEGDGNGLLEDYFGTAASYSGFGGSGGETAMFWVDLSTVNMGGLGIFNTATPTGTEGSNNDVYPTGYLPLAKIGNSSYLYVWSGGLGNVPTGINGDGKNYISIAQVTDYGYGARANPTLTVAQAYYIDKKIDDGLPQSGKVQAFFLNAGAAGNGLGEVQWAAGGGNSGGGSTVAGASSNGLATTAATSASVNTCYDNGYAGGAAAPMHYSMEISNGANVNCALSFQMQGAAR